MKMRVEEYMKSKVVLFILFLMNLIFSISSFVLIINSNSEVTFDKLYSSVVEIKVNIDGVDYYGSAVCIKNNFLVTNFHIIMSEKSQVYYRSCYSKTYNNSSIIGLDEHNDLALLSINDAKIKPIKFASDIQNGTDVYSLGNTLNQGITISKGIISNCNIISDSITYICSDNIIDDGNSGGALVNSKKELIGITTFRISNIGYSYSISYENVLKFINEFQI
jgi:S1-C subfamily serine protease